MPNQTYIATTTGPIVQTINEAKRSRAKWAASYFFSWFNKRLFALAENAGYKILLPSNYKPTSKQGAGFYADRLFFYKEVDCSINNVEALANKVVVEIATDIATHTNKRKNKVEDWLHQYINLHIKEVTATGSFHLQELNQQLDQAELFQNMPFNYDWNPLQEYFALKLGTATTLSKDAFTQPDRFFSSIGEIATTTLLRQNANKYKEVLFKDFKNEDVELIDELSTNEAFKLLPHHKYYAVMYADGDNIGKLLEALNKPGKEAELVEFSKQLFKFGEQTEKTIFDYGGNGIYLGGEDILAFLPLACINNDGKTTQTIFQLIAHIDKNWQETVQKVAGKNNIDLPTLSYGIQIAYYKFPLKEAMNKAHALMDKAKDKNIHPCKNTIGLCFQKHSGQFMKCFVEKAKQCSYESVLQMVEKYTQDLKYDEPSDEPNGTNQLLSGLIHRFKDPLFKSVLIPAARANRLDSFFTNFFNEDVHKEAAVQNVFLKEVQVFSQKIFNDYPQDEDSANILYTIMRIIHFINSKTDQDA